MMNGICKNMTDRFFVLIMIIMVMMVAIAVVMMAGVGFFIVMMGHNAMDQRH